MMTGAGGGPGWRSTVLSFGCSTCEAMPGEPCRSSSGQLRYDFHAPRSRAASEHGWIPLRPPPGAKRLGTVSDAAAALGVDRLEIWDRILDGRLSAFMGEDVDDPRLWTVYEPPKAAP